MAIMKQSIELIRSLAVKNTQLCAWVGGFQSLVKAIIDPRLHQHSH